MVLTGPRRVGPPVHSACGSGGTRGRIPPEEDVNLPRTEVPQPSNPRGSNWATDQDGGAQRGASVCRGGWKELGCGCSLPRRDSPENPAADRWGDCPGRGRHRNVSSRVHLGLMPAYWTGFGGVRPWGIPCVGDSGGEVALVPGSERNWGYYALVCFNLLGM